MTIPVNKVPKRKLTQKTSTGSFKTLIFAEVVLPQKYAKIRRKLSPTLQNLIDAKIRNSEEVLLVVLMETRTLSGFNQNTLN